MIKKRNKKNAPPYGEHAASNGQKVGEDKGRHHRFRRRFIKSPKFKKYLELHTAKDKYSEDDLGSLYSAYTMLTKKEPYIITAADSRIGDRLSQQDAYFVSRTVPLSPFRLKRTLAVVCDGMGGLDCGDRASETAVSMLRLAFGKLPTKKVDIPHFFSQMTDYIDFEINHWEDLPSDRGAGTTLVAVILENRRLYWVSVGDSSIYIFQDNTLKRITTRHNYRNVLEKLVEEGKLTKQQADSDPQKDSLMSYLGMGDIEYRDINSKPYVMRDGDMLILCTDGVTNALDESEMTEIIKDSIDDPYRCSMELNRIASEKKGIVHDNSTVVIVQYVE